MRRGALVFQLALERSRQTADEGHVTVDAGLNRKKKEKHQSHRFKEGWVEFEDKRVARSVAEMLNAQPIGALFSVALVLSVKLTGRMHRRQARVEG